MTGTNRKYFVIFLPVLTAAAAIVYLYDPSSSWFYPKCLFYRLTGLYCPGCGSTRAVHQLLHGNIAAAFKLNPLTVTALPFLVFGIVLEMGVFHSRPKWLSYVRQYSKLLLLGLILFWILRNIPVEPFIYLRP
ncbi:DUF2752 domain-containing protein [Candidatus Magnetominusculus xianensis]|uniref:DUF2752 domain-containing protein n=1 Tax=Candidatus Magnetominusculus xianensis TaxID=1748249 RepID=A0ABR5SJY1_9BACT|nr:DUF2752 domain-containing protein [Candidatus Magnetominusculus xianensis]KWT92861.1 hypothetical protein ASN18_0447 [Candidatus Magnetominusculus xianensis]MBF0403450.1 DUF2752 domain-containing protein [Nitrospirota bacterium]